MSVVVVHPQVQHSFQLARALCEAGLLRRFSTSIFITTDTLKNYPARIRKKLQHRSSLGIPKSKVSTFPYIEILWHITGLLVTREWQGILLYYNLRLFDRWAARRLSADSPRIVIGFENSSLAIFREAKRIGALCVLDAASVHYNHQAKALSTGATEMNRKVDLQKAEEIALADKILVLSTFARQTYIDAGVPAEKLVTIALGANVELFSQKTPRSESASFNYLFVGNLTGVKGVDLLVEAFAGLDVPGKTLTLVGSGFGNLSPEAKALANLRWTGRLSPAELRDEYQRADVFVLPSRLDGFGLVVAEAMATGTPVIVSSAVGAKDLVSENENGWIFESGNLEALKHAMEIAYANRGRLIEMGHQARETVVKDYTWEAYRRRAGEFYTNLLNSLKPVASID